MYHVVYVCMYVCMLMLAYDFLRAPHTCLFQVVFFF